MSEVRKTETMRIPKTLIAKMDRDGFPKENRGCYLEMIYDQDIRAYKDGDVISIKKASIIDGETGRNL